MRCCDTDQDGDIELVDLVMIAMNFGSGPDPGSDLADLRHTAANLGSGGSVWRVVPRK